ncbi:MAG: hypothetical protein Q8M15_06925 [Bacteroidota bacterium]|nr:hypothetical protein [Bacteroidota bacterium]
MDGLNQKYSFVRLSGMGKILLIICLIGLGTSCKKSIPAETLDMGYAYFPIDTGLTWIYHVDSISYNDNTQSIDTFRFFLMERISGQVADQLYKNHQIVERYVRKNDSDTWHARANSYILKTANNVQVVDENIRIVKLIFPLGNVQSWNGNMYNDKIRQTYSLQALNAPYNTGDTTYLNSVTVIHDPPINVIEEILIKSVYARDIGLISFSNTYINTQVSGKSGYRVSQKLISFYKP